MKGNLKQLEKQYCSKADDLNFEKRAALAIIERARLEKPKKNDVLQKFHETHKRKSSKEQEIKEIQVI